MHGSCCLTFELSGRQRQDARPGLAKMYRVPTARARWPAVGAPLERGVRRPCVAQRGGWVCVHWQPLLQGLPNGRLAFRFPGAASPMICLCMEREDLATCRAAKSVRDSIVPWAIREYGSECRTSHGIYAFDFRHRSIVQILTGNLDCSPQVSRASDRVVNAQVLALLACHGICSTDPV